MGPWAPKTPYWAAGRYDKLAETLGSKTPAPGIGFSIGEDRLVMTVEASHAPNPFRLDVYIAPMGDTALRHCAVLAAIFENWTYPSKSARTAS